MDCSCLFGVAVFLAVNLVCEQAWKGPPFCFYYVFYYERKTGNKVKCGGMNYVSGQGEKDEYYLSGTFTLNGNTLTDESGVILKKQ